MKETEKWPLKSMCIEWKLIENIYIYIFFFFTASANKYAVLPTNFLQKESPAASMSILVDMTDFKYMQTVEVHQA